MNIDLVFLAASSVTIQNGLANNNYLEADIKRAVVKQCHGKYLVAMVDSSKFERQAIFSYCPIESLNAVVTDRAPRPDICEYLKSVNVDCLFQD